MLSKATFGRLPEYLDYLRRIPARTGAVSATAVAKGLALGEVQVRKDFAAVCGKGKPKTGYALAELIGAMEAALGIHAQSEAVIVGAGRLGQALLEFGEFSGYGISLRCAFDTNADGGNERIRPLSELHAYCSLHQVEIGVITVPSDTAQQAADLLIASGVRAIWCFTVCRLSVPDGVTVQYENMALSLAHLKNRAIHD